MIRTTTVIDISDYEENVLAGMTARQLLLSVIGIAVIVIAYMTANQNMGMQLASYLAICGGLPCFLFAFVRPYKMRLETFLVIWVESNLLAHPIRCFEAENALYQELFGVLPGQIRKIYDKIPAERTEEE